MSERRQSKVDVQVNPSGGSLALIISVIALVFSAVSLYESFFKQPHLHLNIAPTWHYARGEATGDEELIVPLTLTNTGARDATILSIDLTLEKQTGQRRFQSTYRINDGLSTRAFLTPAPVPGKASSSAIIIFTSASMATPLVDAAGVYTAKLRVSSTFNQSSVFSIN
ncbi:MAG: hypothetical protein SH859_11340 [Hyphomicrobium aestuarii]|nr:hypothetical protein [Hyphomicrobium aestuarii]